MSLSGLVVVHNEEDQLKACLDTLKFCHEVVVVLDKCTDRSKDIALAWGARIIEGEWAIEGDRRNQGIQACQGLWILEVDADERIPPTLAEEITQVIHLSPYAVHAIPFDNYIGQTLVRYGWGAYFGVRRKPILFRKGAKTWGQQHVHPKIELSLNQGPELQGRVVHYVDRDITDLLHRLNRYTSLSALDIRAKAQTTGVKEGYGKNIRRLFSRFYKCYIRHKGYREGKWGFLIALCAGLYPLLSYLKAELEEK